MVVSALLLARLKAGKTRLAKMAIIAMTTKSSTNVKALDQEHRTANGSCIRPRQKTTRVGREYMDTNFGIRV
jgi:hypothetical protein